MARPTELPIKKLVRFDEETIKAIEKYRAGVKPIPNQSEAIRQILCKWLEEHGHFEEGAKSDDGPKS